MIWTRLVLAVLFTSLTGTFFSFIWFLLQKFFLRSDGRLCYLLLKVCLFSYLFPFTYFIIKFQEQGFVNSEGMFYEQKFFATPNIVFALTIFCLIWLALIILVCSIRISGYLRWLKLRKGDIKQYDLEVERYIHELIEVNRIKCNINILWNAKLKSPVITGLFRTSIMFPLQNYSKDQVEIIFFHEICHYKRRDLFVKAAGVLVTSIHCFNIIPFLILRQITRWSEVACDIYACKFGQEYFTSKEYFTFILYDMVDNENKDSFIHSSIAQSQSEIEKRIRYMRKYQKTGGFSRKVGCIVLTFFMLSAAFTSLAASQKADDLYDQWYERTDVIETELVEDQLKYNMLKEHYERPEGYSLSQVDNIVEVPLQSARGLKQIDWDIPAGDFWTTTSFWITKGDPIRVLVETIPSDSTIRVGFIEPDGTKRCVESSGLIHHTFTTDKTGFCNFFINNISSVTTRVVGSWSQ